MSIFLILVQIVFRDVNLLIVVTNFIHEIFLACFIVNLANAAARLKFIYFCVEKDLLRILSVLLLPSVAFQ